MTNIMIVSSTIIHYTHKREPAQALSSIADTWSTAQRPVSPIRYLELVLLQVRERWWCGGANICSYYQEGAIEVPVPWVAAVDIDSRIGLPVHMRVGSSLSRISASNCLFS